MDSLTGKYPWYTPYQFAGNTPIQAIDLDGLEEIYYFTPQRAKFKGLDMALKILNKSGIMAELAEQFALGNKITDIYINIRPLSTTGNTKAQYVEGFEKNLYVAEASRQIVDEKPKALEVEFIKRYTLEKGKTAIFVNVNEELLKKAEKDEVAVNDVAETILHEILKHAMDEKDRKDDVPTGQEHREYYEDDEFYSKYSDQYSPKYEDIKPNSVAGKYKARIEKAAKEIKTKSESK